MNNEKVKNMFKGKRKNENLVVLLIIMVVVVISINYIWNDGNKNNENKNTQKTNNVKEVLNNEDYSSETEKKLENILSSIDGVGKVKVMILNSSSSTFVPVYDENNKTSNTTESDDSGGTRTIIENDQQKSIVYKENSNGTKEPITKNIESPKIEGAIITAQGANSSDVKEKIVSAVEAATGLATHKIQVFKMDDEKLD